MGVATDCSTVWASAPTYVVCTCTSGGAMAGNCEMGSEAIVITPTMTVSSEITMATIGRLMKNFDISGSAVRRRALDDADGAAISDLEHPSTTTCSPAFSPEVTIHRLPTRSPTVT